VSIEGSGAYDCVIEKIFMKKFEEVLIMSNLKTIVLMASILVGSFLVMPNVSHAEDVWCYSNELTSFYLVSDSVEEIKNAPNGITYRAIGKVVLNKNGSFVNIMIYGFAVPNDNVVGYWFRRAKGTWDYLGPIKKDSKMKAVWQAMKPYLKKKGIYYNDSWE